MKELMGNFSAVIFFFMVFFALFFAVFFLSMPFAGQMPETPSMDFFSAENFSTGKQGKIMASVSFPEGIDSINYLGEESKSNPGEGNELKQPVDCGKQKSCSAEFNAVFASPGVKEIFFLVVSGKNSFELKQFVKVFSGKKICLDGTEFGKCSASYEYCNEGKPEKNCVKCGCASGFECFSNDCVLAAPQINLSKAEFTKTAGIGLNASIDLTLESETAIPSGASFSASLVEGSKTISSTQFSLKEALAQKTGTKISVSFPIDENSIAPGKHLLSAELFFSGKKISSIELGEINFIEKSPSKPAAPSGLQAVVYGNAVDLSWGSSDERIAFFRVYESKTVSSMFVSYLLAGEAEANSFSFDSLSKGTHYFVVKSVDPFGLESDYSGQAIAEVN